MEKCKIKIDYFKPTGKFYSSGEFEMDLETIGEHHLNTLSVPDRIKEMRFQGIRPGLVDSKNCEFVWVVSIWWKGESYMSYLFLPEYLYKVAWAQRR